ncbi:hypothetical protein PQE66_gp087 [Bacillus phage PBC2]|uniref:Uncharacterized protein n=1 Tax=Bacillus phage PBC2 TaxID=1675029 RepID=A0A218KBY4_9CAUD|nr:hypothetical protein PQE66_gp087 [Bacillus phage PBC2]AKQ08402.1 hypothetical protein PBC2_087 [Bacillus phage PBC2]
MVNIELNEKLFEVDYKESLAQIHASFTRMEMDLKRETTQELSDELRRMDAMTQDVLHIIRLVKFNAVEGYTFAKMLQVIQQARGKIKDRMDERNMIKNLIKKYKESMKGQMGSVIQNQIALENYQEKRTYRLRELKELEGYADVINKQMKKIKEMS